jgi:histidine triad (HIT) family protein
MLFMAHELAKDLPGSKAFRLVSNNGHDAGQRVFHIHFHFLAGRELEF